MHYNNIGRLCGKNNWDLNQGCLARGGTEVQQLYPSFLATGHFWQLVIFGNWSFLATCLSFLAIGHFPTVMNIGEFFVRSFIS